MNDDNRQIKADARAFINDSGWINYGNGSGPPAYTYVTDTSFSVTGDATAAYHAGRRVRAVGIVTTTIYGTIASSAFDTTITTVEVVWDSGNLNNETLTVSLGALPVTGTPVPGGAMRAASDTVSGPIEIATAAEVNALADTTRAVTPGRLPIASLTQQGIVELATAAEANALTDATRAITPATLPLASDTQEGLIGIATSAEILAGASNVLAMTPGQLAALGLNANPGYFRLPGGMVVQFGFAQSNASGVATLTFPTPFTTVVYALNGTGVSSNTAAHVATVMTVISVSVTGFTMTTYKIGTTSAVTGPILYYWLAIGV